MVEDLEEAAKTLAQNGVRELISDALRPDQEHVFVAAGFHPLHHLALLRWSNPEYRPAHHRSMPSRPSGASPASADPGADAVDEVKCLDAGFRLGRINRWKAGPLLEVDHLAFDDFWRFDEEALAESWQATSASHLRAIFRRDHSTDSERVVAYATFGLSGTSGYLQRLAVDPVERRQGLATALVADGMRWLSQRRARSCLVNTPIENEAALKLYRRFGFTPEPHGLTMHCRRLTLTDSGAHSPRARRQWSDWRGRR